MGIDNKQASRRGLAAHKTFARCQKKQNSPGCFINSSDDRAGFLLAGKFWKECRSDSYGRLNKTPVLVKTNIRRRLMLYRSQNLPIK